jgi:predicted helicase
MSKQHINHYRKHIAQLMASSGSKNEGVVSKAFGDLLERMGRSSDLVFVPQWESKGPKGNDIRIDGALVPGVLRIPFGYWEAKDEKDDLEKEIAAKRAKGYPVDNIIFEDTKSAVLIQNGIEIDRARLQGDDAALLALLNRFFAYQRPEIAEFRKAAAQFRSDLPQILGALRDALDTAERENADYRQKAQDFLAHTRDAINMAVSAADVREMLIQHILTEAIFARVFDDANYHRENNVARQLTALEQAFFTGALRKVTVDQLKPYYAAITHAATQIADRREKQTFLKRLYEDFYKVYNPNAADRLGVVYTPGEIVRFMIRATDQLCEQHFGKSLIDSGVDILDPATGTGTFIVELLEHFQGDRDKLRHKYKEELHANEVAILPYYVANLNIEATYAAISGQYADFPGLVFVDTLDNTAGLGKYAGHMDDMFGGTSAENLTRVKRQNDRKISVVIGNPPYNAWQSDYNARNANRPYKRIDDRIGATYRAQSSATNTSALSDMYVRFFRWASDRLRDAGVLAFVCNRNFIEKVAFDGFRKSVVKEFADIWVIDLGGDVRANPKLSGTKHNVFGIQTGVCIVLLVKKAGAKTPAVVHYCRQPEEATGREKLDWLEGFALSRVDSMKIKPGADGVWLNPGETGWKAMLPLADPEAGPGDREGPVQAIFRLSSNGLKTQRDDWMWAEELHTLNKKVRLFAAVYETTRSKPDHPKRNLIKWDRELDRYAAKGVSKKFDASLRREGQFRPFVKRWVYFDTHFNGMTYRLPSLFRTSEANQSIAICGMANEHDFAAQATSRLFDKGLLKTGNGNTFGVARYRYTKSGERVDNVTDWAVRQFRDHYGALADGSAIGKDDIFAYVYAALHDPVWRETYAADLRRSFPRIKFHADFATWRDWGQRLLDLHIGYELVEPWGLQRVDVPTDPSRKREGSSVSAVKLKLKSDPDNGAILLDSLTTLKGVPRAAWDYKLGNRSAIDWVLDQHKEKTPRDPTVAAKFNTYRFAEHKDKMIDLLDRVVRVSVETVAITDAMRAVQGPPEN